MRAPPFALTAIGAALLLIARSSAAEAPEPWLDYAVAQAPPSASRAATEAAPPVPAPAGPVPAGGDETRVSLSAVRWALAPIRLRGQLTTDLRAFRADGQPQRFQQSEAASVNAASYIYQPWFAQVALGLTGLMSKERGEAQSRSTSLGGNASVSVFPSSRFPFQASFDRTDSRSTDQFTGQDYQTQRIGVRQGYRTPKGDQSSSASYDRSTLTSSSFGRDTVDVIELTHARPLGPGQNIDANANRVLNRRSAGSSQADRAFARHVYATSDDALLRLETMASYGGSQENFATGAGSSGLRTDTFQVNSFGSWRRSDDDPLQVTGGARYFQSTLDGGGSASEARSITGYGAATYRYSPKLLLNGGGSVSQNAVAGAGGLATSQFAGATYTPDTRSFGGFLYSSSLGANATNQTSGEAGARQTVSGTGNHSVHRAFDVGGPQALSVNASQSLGVSQDSSAGALTSLSHSGGASMRLARGDALTGFVSASASDSRTSGYSSSSFQLVNVQLSGQGQLGRYSSVTGNYTIQGARQDTTPFNLSQNGGVTYQHQRAFGVPRLRYYATYERSDYQLNTRAQGNLDASHEFVSSSFEQRLEYRIGRVDTRLSLRIAEIDGRKNALLFLRIVRQFGD